MLLLREWPIIYVTPLVVFIFGKDGSVLKFKECRMKLQIIN